MLLWQVVHTRQDGAKDIWDEARTRTRIKHIQTRSSPMSSNGERIEKESSQTYTNEAKVYLRARGENSSCTNGTYAPYNEPYLFPFFVVATLSVGPHEHMSTVGWRRRRGKVVEGAAAVWWSIVE